MSGDKQQSGSKAIITCLFGLFRESIIKKCACKIIHTNNFGILISPDVNET